MMKKRFAIIAAALLVGVVVALVFIGRDQKKKHVFG